MPANHCDLEKRLWDAADELRANSKLKSSEYSIPVLGFTRRRQHFHWESQNNRSARTRSLQVQEVNASRK
jgi:hypothetical protein